MVTILARRSGALALAAVFGVALAGRAAPQATVEDLVARNLAARGGLARLKAIETIRQTATMSMMGTQVAMTTYMKRPNMVRQEMTVDKQRVINGFDGETPWIVNPIVGATRPIIVSGPQADLIRQQSGFDGPLADYKADGTAVTVEGVEASGNRTLIHLKLVSPRSLQIRHLYLDSVTYLDAKVTTEQDQVTLDQEFDDYRDVDGVKWPFRVRTSINGVVQSDMTVEKVEFNVKMDDELFRVPKAS
jgi:outer membrane lipoprotein-sorting protein